MILSHEHRFIFIKTRKTAGTSIEVFLSSHCGEGDVVTPIWPAVEGHRPRNHTGVWNPIPELRDFGAGGVRHAAGDFLRGRRFYNHMPARLVRARIGERTWRSYFKFCVERNPWDKTLSHYHMVRDRAGRDLAFDEYLRGGEFATDYALYTDRSGDLIVDHVLRYERLSADLAEVFDRLGVAFDGNLGVRAKGGHRADRRPYRDVYTEEQRERVRRAFASEIAALGYEF